MPLVVVKQMTSDAISAIASTLPVVSISAVFSAVRMLVSKNKFTIKSYVLSTAVSIPVGIITGSLFSSLEFSHGVTWTAVSISSLLSNDIIVGIIKIGDDFAKNPEKTINRLRK